MSKSDAEKLIAGGLFEDISRDIQAQRNSLEENLSSIPIKPTLFEVMKEQSLKRKKGFKKLYSKNHLFYQKMRPNVCLYKFRNLDAGYDILNDQLIVFEPHEQKIVDLGICIEISEGYGGFLYFTSSFSKAHKFVLSAGVIDSGYTGVLKANVISLSSEVQHWKPNTRIIQIVIKKIFHKSPRCVESGLFKDTDRGFR